MTSDGSDYASFYQSRLASESLQNGLKSAIEVEIPGLSVEEMHISEDIRQVLEFTIDANDSSRDLSEAALEAEELMSTLGAVNVDTEYLTQSPTLFPSTSFTGNNINFHLKEDFFGGT